ncbi:SHOCT domain-containing protein [Pseudolactococcus reticulitermitis]
MEKQEVKADMLYHISLSVAKSMLENGAISQTDYQKIDTILLEKYHPYLGELLSPNALTL